VDLNKLIARAKAILLTPKTEWPVIAAEPDTVGGLFASYIAILALVPALCGFLRMSVIGISMPFLGSYRVGMGSGLSTAVLSYVLALVGVFVVSLIVNALAPTFGGQKDKVQALKAVAYSYTAGWVASVIGLVPGLGIIAALAGLVYGLYLLYLGLPPTMKCPPDKAVGYTVVTVICAIVVAILAQYVVGRVMYMGGAYGGFGSPMSSIGRMHRDGGLQSDGGFAKGSAGEKLDAWTKQMQQATKQMDAAQKSGDTTAQANAVGQMLGAALGAGGKVQALPPDRLKPFVPDTLAGLKRTQLTSERNGALGMQISDAKAQYSDGADHSLNLDITDTGSLKGIVGFAAGWGGVEQDKETDTGYDKTYKSDGRIVHEKWDNQSHRGEYGMVVGDRFSVQVSGSAGNIDELKSALMSLNLAGLEALKNEGVQAAN
jgi:hypothetical protein